MEKIRETAPNPESVPAQVVQAFFFIASHNKCHKQALEAEMNFTMASASRACDYLSTHHRLGKPGMGLIEKITDPSNRRRIELHLTPKGHQLADTIKDIIYGS